MLNPQPPPYPIGNATMATLTVLEYLPDPDWLQPMVRDVAMCMHMHVCIHVYMYMYVYMYIYVYICVYICIYICITVHCQYTYIVNLGILEVISNSSCLLLSHYWHIYIYIYLYIYIYIYLYMYIYIYVSIHTYTYTYIVNLGILEVISNSCCLLLSHHRHRSLRSGWHVLHPATSVLTQESGYGLYTEIHQSMALRSIERYL
jgi:hypothetical protein